MPSKRICLLLPHIWRMNSLPIIFFHETFFRLLQYSSVPPPHTVILPMTIQVYYKGVSLSLSRSGSMVYPCECDTICAMCFGFLSSLLQPWRRRTLRSDVYKSGMVVLEVCRHDHALQLMNNKNNNDGVWVMLRSRLTVHTLDARRSLKVENNNNILAKRYAYVYVHLLMEQKSYYIDSHLFMIATWQVATKQWRFAINKNYYTAEYCCQ